ncbi:4-hydroxy-2-oxoheptanedioate aldolase [Bordetella sp. FB-8]|uniref:4-hydroxy-2-oxoheptanedioate aldolase n=1 Tax=Bordetella sp. FB-8 TaxID=1159870 RepID=UPI00035C5DF4|nr:4-hydroxy-2-oxoheptanedioate aldolase [Bordetella sp. FB-8]
MEMPRNTFKAALKAGQAQIGLWVGLSDSYVAEALGGAGFDWLLIDGEHAPNDVRSILRQLQALAAYPVHPIVRPVIGDAHLIKQILEVGAQTLLIPVVETAEQAREMVAATRYPPHGIRGVGSALARSSRWNQIKDYVHKADEQMCLLVQVETRAGMENLDQIAAVPGVDGVFFGPADLSASMGYLGQTTHPQVHKAILDGIRRVRDAGKAPGILCSDEALSREYLAAGALFVAVGVDSSVLVRAATQLAQSFKGPPAGAGKTQSSSGY